MIDARSTVLVWLEVVFHAGAKVVDLHYEISGAKHYRYPTINSKCVRLGVPFLDLT